MRIYSFIFFILISIQSLKADVTEYVFLQWNCSETLLLEGELVTSNTRYEKQFQFPFDNVVNVSLSNEIYIPLSDCENNYFHTLHITNPSQLEFSQGLERRQRKLHVSIFPFKQIDGVWHKLLYTSLEFEKKPIAIKKEVLPILF